MLFGSIEKQVKQFLTDEVKILCDSFMLNVIMIKALTFDVPGIVTIDVNGCHAKIWNIFMKFGMNDVHWIT
jgi:hypothetical protein